MFKKVSIGFLMISYLYVLTFGIFLNNFFRIPTPFIFCLPLLILFGSFKNIAFVYKKEILLFAVATFFAVVLVQSDFNSFLANLIVTFFCIFYFNFFVNDKWARYRLSIVIFYLWLAISSAIMFLNHIFPAQIDPLRVFLTGYTPAFQSPSGISQYIFTFGYQAAALTTFAFTGSIIYRKHFIIKALIFIVAFLIIYFGLQRSVLVTFGLSSFLLILMFYRLKSIWILGLAAIVSLLVFSTLADRTKGYDNIFAKNERDAEAGRSDLVLENLKIFTDYPYGLIFHGKSWSEATRNRAVFSSGISSHNAYLMFLTFLGPFLGIGLLLALYQKIWKLFRYAIVNIYDTRITLLICLCFSFLSVSLNSMSHNAWLLSGNGPTIFLYFAILHYGKFFLNGVVPISEVRNS